MLPDDLRECSICGVPVRWGDDWCEPCQEQLGRDARDIILVLGPVMFGDEACR